MRSRNVLPMAMALLLLSGCSEKLLAPSFSLAGEWTGSIADPTIIGSNEQSLKIAIEARIREDGQTRIDAQRLLNFGSFSVNARVIMEVEVMPDGSVTGEGSYTLGTPFNVARSGEVIGQLSGDTGYGTGALILEETSNDTPMHMGWTLRRSGS